MAAIAAASDGTIERLLTLPLPRSEDWLYRDTVLEKDIPIAKSYEDQFRYVPPSAEARTHLASGVLRVRLESSIKSFTRKGLAAAAARKHQQAIAKNLDVLKDASVPISPEPGAPSIHVGYDLLADASKLEVIAPKWSLGAYHSNLSGVFSSARNPAAFTLRATMALSAQVDSAILFVPGTATIEGSLGKWISPRLRAAAFAAQAPGNQRCGLHFSYSL